MALTFSSNATDLEIGKDLHNNGGLYFNKTEYSGGTIWAIL